MLFYLAVIGVSFALIFLIGIILMPYSGMLWYEALLTTLILTLSVIAIDGLDALMVRKLIPEKPFDKEEGCFVPKKGEIRFLEKTGIRRWKDKIWELGRLGTDISKAHVEKKNDSKYLRQFIIESNYGQAIHLSSAIVSYLIIFIHPFTSLAQGLPYALMVASVSAFLNILPYMVLRYNTPRLIKLRSIILSKEKS